MADQGGKKLRFYQKIAFGTGHMLPVLAAAGMWFPYNVSFFQNVLKLSPTKAGNIVLIAQAVGAICMPFIGMWSDQTHCKYGRRKIFHLFGVIAFACSFFFIWHDCFGCSLAEEDYKVLYYSSFAIVFQGGWAAIMIAHLALVPELTDERSVKVELNSIRYGFQVGGTLFVFVIFWILLENIAGDADSNKLNPQDKTVFWVMALIVTILGALISMIFQLFIKEKKGLSPPKLPWYKWLGKIHFYLFALTYVASKIVTLFSLTYMPFYFTHTLSMDKTSIAKGPLLFYVSSFVVTFLVKRFSRYLGEKMTYFLGLALVWTATIWMWVKQPSDDPNSSFNIDRDSLYIAIILLGAGGACMIVMSLSFISFFVGVYTGSSAFVYGWVLFFDRLSNGLLTQLVQSLQPAQSNEYYRRVMVFSCFGATGAALIALAIIVLLERFEKQIKSSGGVTATATSINDTTQLVDSAGCVQQQSPSGEPIKGKRRKALTDHLLHRKRKVTLVDEKKIADFNSSMTI